MLKLGIIGHNFKDNERRLPIHPRDFQKINEHYRKSIYIDTNYGINFGYTDEQLRPYVGEIVNKEDIYKMCDIVLMLKYTHNDYKMMTPTEGCADVKTSTQASLMKSGLFTTEGFLQPNKICWGWHHLVQNKENVDLILEKKLTAISIEQMFENGNYILEDNRLIAGYASIMHSFQLKGLTGYLLDSVDQPKIAVISYGCVGKGAVSALISLKMSNVDVFTRRNPDKVTEKCNNVNYYVYPEQTEWVSTLKRYDVIVNCILQDPLNPIIFLKKEDIIDLQKRMFIVDISCDTKMGFDFAKPLITTFEKPIIKITDNVDYYGIDHTPSIYYDTVTRKISEKLLKYIEYIIDNNLTDNDTLKNAIEIDKGIIINQTINQFQNRLI